MEEAGTTSLLDHVLASEEPKHSVYESSVTEPVAKVNHPDYNPLATISPNYILQKGDALKQHLSSKTSAVRQNIASRANVLKSMAIEKRSIIKTSK